MKADPFAQRALLEVQQRDSTLAQLAHRRTTVPALAELETLAAERKALDGRRVEHETAVADLSREQRKADGEVEQVRSRRTRDQQRMDSGQITSPKDLENLQSELAALDRRIGTLEDEELEVMESLEQAQQNLTAVQNEIATNEQDIAAAERTRDEAFASIDAEAETLRAEREEAVVKVPDDLIALYDKVRGQESGLGAAALRQRRCEGCRLELNGADLREIAAMGVDEVVRCPECNRILVRTEESGL